MDFLKQPIINGSTNCTNDIQRVFNGYTTNDPISIAVFESIQSPPIFNTKNTVNLGDMSSCIAVNYLHPSPDIAVQHCIMTYSQTNTTGISQLGLCVPKSCSMIELKSFVEAFLVANQRLTWKNISFYNEWCKTGEYKLDSKDTIILCIFGILLTLVFTSTIYDLYVSKIKLGTPKLLLSSFSFNRNLKDLFKVQSTIKGERSILFRSMFGIRVLSIYWILNGHAHYLLTAFPSIHLNEARARFYHPLIVRGYGVDCFFVMAGCLCAYGVLRHGKGLKLRDLPSFIMKRYLRLTPLVAIVIMMEIIIGKYLETKWPYNQYVHNNIYYCEQLWWKNIIYIEPNCAGWMWYLAAEFQLYILAAVILVIAKFIKNDLYLFVFLSSLVVIFTIVVFCGIWFLKDSFWFKSHGRANIFLIGMILGYWFSFKAKQQQSDPVIEIPKRTLQILFYLSWFFMLCVLLVNFLVFGVISLPRFIDVILQTLHRPAFAVIVALMIAYSETGRAGIVGWFLSLEWLEPLSKLNYGVFLLNEPVIIVLYLTYGTPVYHSEFQTFMRSIAVYRATVLMSIPLYVCVELPFVRLIKLLFKKTENKCDTMKNKDKRFCLSDFCEVSSLYSTILKLKKICGDKLIWSFKGLKT